MPSVFHIRKHSSRGLVSKKGHVSQKIPLYIKLQVPTDKLSLLDYNLGNLEFLILINHKERSYQIKPDHQEKVEFEVTPSGKSIRLTE